MPRPVLPPSRTNRSTLPNRPEFQFRIERAGTLPQADVSYIEGQVISGAMLRGSSGLLLVDGVAHGLVVVGQVMGLHTMAREGRIALVVQRPSFDLSAVEPGTVFASRLPVAQAA